VSITVRPLYLDTKLKEYTAGPVHDITDRVFVIRRAYRVNDRCRRNRQRSHAGCGNVEAGSLVERNTGRIRQIKLLDFYPYYSDVKLVPRPRRILRSCRCR